MPLVELQNFLNNFATDSHNLGRARTTPTPSRNLEGNRPTKKRPLNNHDIEGSNDFSAVKDLVVDVAVAIVDGGRGRPSSNTGRIDFSTIDGALTAKERERHQE
jgi:hypothetical protein